MSNPANGLSTTMTTSPLSPYLIVEGAAQALDWYRDTLGAVETTRYAMPGGKIGHAEILIGEARLMLADADPEQGYLAPTPGQRSPVTLHLEVDNVDSLFRRAVDAGADGEREPADQSHGNRHAVIVDPFGHRWMFSQPLPAHGS